MTPFLVIWLPYRRSWWWVAAERRADSGRRADAGRRAAAAEDALSQVDEDALAQVDEDALARDYAPARFVQADIHPQIWDEADVLVEYLLPNLRKLTDFYAQASAREEAVVLALT